MTYSMPGNGGGGEPYAGGGTATAPAPRGRVLVPTLIVLGVLVVLLVIASGFYSEWLWFVSVDNTEIYSTRLITQTLLFLVFGGFMWVCLMGNALWAYRSRPAFGDLTAEQASLERYRMAIEPYRRTVAMGSAALFAVMTGLSAGAEWQTFQLWRNRGEFGTTDPQFGLDVGFFVFSLPWLRFVLGFLFAVTTLALLTAIAVQYLYGGIRLQTRGQRFSRAATVQVAVLGGIFLLLKAVGYWLDRYELATQSKSLVPGFTGLSYTDVHAVLPSKTILTFAALVVAVLFFIAAVRGSWALPLIGAVVLMVTSLIIGWAYPAFVQYFQVRPTELEREAPYIERNIQATLGSYELDEVERQSYAGNEVATLAEVRRESGTLDNVRLLDPAVVSPTFRQLQQIRGFYSFPDSLDIDRYTLDDDRSGQVVSVRELDLEGLPLGQRNWTNDTTVFTHGYGFVSAFDNTAQSNGQPEFSEKDIPPEGVLDIEEPRVYFGESSPPYSIVGAPDGAPPQEFDFPDDTSPNGQRNNTYSGSGGAPVGSTLNKLVFALKFQDSNILLSDRVNSDSRILFDRDPRQMVEKVAPWLTLDGDPYPVVADGRILWMVDGYTTSNQYPNAARTALADATTDSVNARISPNAQSRVRLNYMRNSVKATVDAYNGTVTLYAWDESDPILQAWQKAFPNTLRAKSEMPTEILAHVRYPEDIFKVQRTVFSRYHVSDPAAFYSGQDFWIVPSDPTKPDDTELQPPYYLILQMPGTTQPSFSLTTAFAPSRRPTLAAFMAANSDPGDDYGTIRVLQLPRNTTIPGPTQVQNNFESDPVVAQQLSLLRRGGSEVVLGNLLSLPVADGMLYVEPVYVRAVGEQGFPLLRKVLVGYGPKVAMEDTLEQALAQVFIGGSGGSGGGGSGGGGATGDPQADLTRALADAQAAFTAGEEALAQGDFAAYGEAQEDLKQALARAAQAQAQLTGETPEATTGDAGDAGDAGTEGTGGSGTGEEPAA